MFPNLVGIQSFSFVLELNFTKLKVWTPNLNLYGNCSPPLDNKVKIVSNNMERLPMLNALSHPKKNELIMEL